MDGLRLGVVRGISYGLFGPPDEFGAAARALGAGLVRAYVYWGQVEREPGVDDWTAVDALLAQLDGDGEVWITVCSSSPWATRVPTDFLPPSPARDLDAYEAFVQRLVRRCRGRVRFWQCDNEPSNTALLWAGSAPEYVAQLRAFAAAVRRADPRAQVVLGGCGYDVLSSPAGSEPRQFFDHLVGAGRDWFDVFDVHLYGDPNAVPAYVEQARDMMAAHGYAKPVVAGEQGGPLLFEFGELEPIVARTFAAAFAEAPATQKPMTQSTSELIERAAQETPERRAMRALYARMSELPPRLRMLMDGCEPELEAKRHRINCRQLVVRTVLAAAAGLRHAAYWQLAPEVPGAGDPYQMMHLLFGKLPLLDYAEDRRLTRRHPAAETFALLAAALGGATAVTRLDSPDHPALRAFRIERPGRGPLLVAWIDADSLDADAFDGEDLPAVEVELPWDGPMAGALDAFGQLRTVEMCAGAVRFDATVTPLLGE